MTKPKPARAPQAAKRRRAFSLVSAEAQQQIYRALCALKANANGNASGVHGVPAGGVQEGWSGAEIAEIAVCLAAGDSCPLVLACPAAGARIVSPQRAKFVLVEDPVPDANRIIAGPNRRLTSATLAAMDALLTRATEEDTPAAASGGNTAKKNARGRNARKQSAHSREEVAIVCAGLLEGGSEAERDYRAAFRFAARHKLPVLYVIANRLAPSPQRKPLDLRSIHPEFGIPLFTIDANDAIAAYRVATEALHNARHLRGPSVIEALALPQTSAAADHPLQLLTAYMERHGNTPQE